MEKPIIVIGAGPAGLQVAISIVKNFQNKEGFFPPVIVIDREKHAGGILNQCIHTGFGLAEYKEELTGPEYASRVLQEFRQLGIELRLSTTVIRVDENKMVTTLSPHRGLEKINALAIIFTTGCRERARGVIHIPGDRPAGIYTAGLAQKFINIDGYLPGKRVVILGSGDIGLIMARRLTFQGAKVLAVLEANNFVGGLARNVVQCLDDFNIPLYLSHTITDIIGKNRVEKVKISRVDENMRPVWGSEFELACDTILLSIGLIPENELAEMAGVKLDPSTNGAVIDENYMTSIKGIFACGNALHVHDLVDKLAVEAKEVGKNVAEYVDLSIGNSSTKGSLEFNAGTSVNIDENIRYILPHKISGKKTVKFHFRVRKPLNDVTLRMGNFQKRFPYLLPNEMSSVTIPAEYFERIDGDYLELLAVKGVKKVKGKEEDSELIQSQIVREVKIWIEKKLPV